LVHVGRHLGDSFNRITTKKIYFRPSLTEESDLDVKSLLKNTVLKKLAVKLSIKLCFKTNT